jgi:peptidylprolyl isomerase
MRALPVLAAASLLMAAAPEKKPVTAAEVLAAAPASAWRTIAADDLLVLDLAHGGRVVIQLAPEFAPVHVANIRALARSGWWTNSSVYRVQDNFVAQWGHDEKGPPLPAGVIKPPPQEYWRSAKGLAIRPL